MASIRKAGKSWEVFVSKNGVRKSATFPTKIEAQNWGAATEADIISGKVSGIPDKTFGDLLSKYANEVSPNKRGSRWEIIRINKYLKDDIAKVHLRDLNSSHFAAWRDMRLKEVGNGSVLREWNILSNACKVARDEWRWILSFRTSTQIFILGSSIIRMFGMEDFLLRSHLPCLRQAPAKSGFRSHDRQALVKTAVQL